MENDRAKDNEARITLGLLSAVGESSALTQRGVARQLGIALGLANAYLKRCVKKGYVKIKQVPPNRYAYYLTAKGFAEKSRLTAEYLSYSFRFFREARKQCTALLAECAQRGWERLALAGVGDLAEIAILCAREHSVTLVAVVDDKVGLNTFAGLPVVASFGALDGVVDAVIVTDVEAPQATFDAVVKQIAAKRVLAPPLFNLSRRNPS